MLGSLKNITLCQSGVDSTFTPLQRASDKLEGVYCCAAMDVLS